VGRDVPIAAEQPPEHPELSGGCDLRQETTKPTLRLRRNGRVGILSGQAEIFEMKTRFGDGRNLNNETRSATDESKPMRLELKKQTKNFPLDACLFGTTRRCAAWLGMLLTAIMLVDVRASEPREIKPEPGLTYTNEKITSEPWSIHVLKIDRSRSDLTFFSAHARDRVLAVSLIADQARAVPREMGRAIAGINGDYYVRDLPPYSGDPRGLQIINGELISAPDTVCVWFDTNANPHLDEVKGHFKITWPDGRETPFGLNQQRLPSMSVLYTPTYGPSTRAAGGGRELILEKDGDGLWLPLQPSQTYRARVRQVQTNGNARLSTNVMVLSLAPQLPANLPELTPGAVLQISTATTPDLKGVKVAIGGGPALVKDGKLFSQKTPPPGTTRDWSQRSKYERNPRSAMGWNATNMYFVVVDGRQPGLSVGMKLAELAEYMAKLGCTEAMNLDGGKSAQLWVSGRIMNSPSEGENTVANSLLVVRKP